MNFQFLIEKLESSEQFKEFINQNKDAYLCSGFFILDYESNFIHDKYSLDFYIPSTKKMISFELKKLIKMVPIETYDSEIPTKINLTIDFDFEEIKNKLIKEIESRNIKNKVQKILLSLQNKGGSYFLLGTIFISNLSLIKITISITDMKIIDFEKKSFFDMLKTSKDGSL